MGAEGVPCVKGQLGPAGEACGATTTQSPIPGFLGSPLLLCPLLDLLSLPVAGRRWGLHSLFIHIQLLITKMSGFFFTCAFKLLSTLLERTCVQPAVYVYKCALTNDCVFNLIPVSS